MSLDSDKIQLWLRQQITGRGKSQTRVNRNQPIMAHSESILQLSQREAQLTFALTLRETETIWLMNISSGYDESNSSQTSDSQLVASSWKCLNAESQTAKNSEKSKNFQTIELKAVHSFVNASAWDLYDTYAEVGFGIKEFQLLIDTALKSFSVVQAQPGFASEITRMPAEKQMKRLIKQDRFQYCVLVMERLLASKTFGKKQRLLKTQTRAKFDTVPSSSFSYQVSLLWTYDNHFMIPMAVTWLDWNPKNSILLAVSYGSLNFQDEECGCICIWSPKNPCHPERKIQLGYSVTTVCFSKEKSNILAAGCHNGHVLLLDVALTEPIIRLFPRYGVSIRYGPIWKIEWFCQVTANGAQEQLLALGDSGCLSCYSFPNYKSSRDILNLDYTIRVANQAGFSSKTLSGLSFSLVAPENMCYIASKQGVVMKCKIKEPCSKDLCISAHLGPVYVIQHSPVCSRIFLTCGSDHFLKIWLDSIPEPLLTLSSNRQKAMVCAQWSPIIPTMIASVSTSELIIWDIARKSTQPINTLIVRSADLAFSTLKFFPDGMGVAVGDQQGHVKVYQLSELPRSPHLKVEALVSAIRNALITRTELLYKFNKCLHFSPQETFTTQ